MYVFIQNDWGETNDFKEVDDEILSNTPIFQEYGI